jgi:hypothetical protein
MSVCGMDYSHTRQHNPMRALSSLHSAIAVSSSRDQHVTYLKSLACCVRLKIYTEQKNILLLYELELSENTNT